MNYFWLNCIFLAAVLLLALPVMAQIKWRAIAYATAALLAITAIFDNVIIGLGIVAYDPALITGIKVGLAPIEDFAYTVAAVMILPTVWILLGGRKEKK